ncbi:hypothetical protein Tco_1289925 [Tanacetum coccineum]
MLLEERQLQSNCMTWFKEIKIHLETLLGKHMRPYENAFQIFFQEEYETFRVKMYHNLNQLQWQLEKENLYSCDPKTCLGVLITQFKEFFDSKRRNLLRYLDVHYKLINERALKYGELRMKEREVQAIKDIEKWLKESEMQKQDSLVTKGAALEASLVTEGATLEACLVNEGIAMDDNLLAKESTYDSVTSSEQLHESSSSGNEIRISDNASSRSGNDANANIRPLYDNDYEQQRAFFASLINNLTCDVEKCNKVHREAQQANGLLTNKLERYKQNEKHFAKDKTIESEYYKKIKLLNDDISNLKSQACQNDKTFARENGKFDENAQPILKRKNELEKKN